MKLWNQALRLLLFSSVLTGLMYPLFVTAIAQWCCSWRANGSLVTYQNQTIGSYWLGQHFTADDYFWGRPSAMLSDGDMSMVSGGSNEAITNASYHALLQYRIRQLQGHTTPIPAMLVMASGSGFDPDISPDAAFYQVDRVASARHLPRSEVVAIIQQHIKPRAWQGVLGEPTVNVLALNRALDEHRPQQD